MKTSEVSYWHNTYKLAGSHGVLYWKGIKCAARRQIAQRGGVLHQNVLISLEVHKWLYSKQMLEVQNRSILQCVNRTTSASTLGSGGKNTAARKLGWSSVKVTVSMWGLWGLDFGITPSLKKVSKKIFCFDHCSVRYNPKEGRFYKTFPYYCLFCMLWIATQTRGTTKTIPVRLHLCLFIILKNILGYFILGSVHLNIFLTEDFCVLWCFLGSLRLLDAIISLQG